MSHVTIQQHDIYYEMIDGDPNKPVLIFLHEGLGCIPMWRKFPEKLCADTGCSGLIYDRMGYGRSSAAKKRRTIHYLHESALQELPAFIASIIPSRPYILIGHSDGGSIALMYGAEQPKYLVAVITEAAHVFVESETIAGIKEATTAWHNGKLKGLAKYHGEKTEQVFFNWSDTWLSDGFIHWNIEYLLPSITAPLLVIQGKDDQYGSEDQVTTIAEKSTGPADMYMVPNCGHTPHLEQPALVLEAMAGFIGRVSPS